MITRAEISELLEGRFTPDSFANLMTHLNAARALRASGGTDPEFLQAASALQAASRALRLTVRYEMQPYLTIARILVNDPSFSLASREILRDRITQAEGLLADPDTPDEVLYAALDALRHSILYLEDL